MPLKELLRLFIEHRINVIRRRTQYQLRQARQRAHIVEGLLIALHHIDEIIRVIRSSANPSEAPPGSWPWKFRPRSCGAL